MSYPWTQAALQMPPPNPAPVSWLRVSRTRPCPICHKPDWCSVAEDGSAACCMRIADGAQRHVDLGHGIGHIHQLNGHAHPAPPSRGLCPPPLPPVLDYPTILARWQRLTPRAALDELAASLGVNRGSLERLDACYCPERRAWAFPMHDGRRQVVGIRLRADDGRKFALPGSHAGAFIPSGLHSRSPLLICEGPTDTAAALTLGFQALGRPSCSGATEIVCDLLQAGRRRDVVIVADADGPGRYGAHRLADRLVGLCRYVKVITAAPHKDLRQWLVSGASPGAVRVRIDNAAYHRNEPVDPKREQP